MSPQLLSATPREDLLVSLERHNASFTTLLSLIPSKFYLAPADPEEADSRWMKNKKRKTGEELKEHKRKAKMDKLDPANNLTTAEIVERNSSRPQPSDHALQTGPEAGPSKTPASGANAQIVPLPPAASISELKAKLQSKLESFRRDRGVDDSDPQSRDALEQAQRARRAELRENRRKQTKQKRKEERDKAAQAGSKPAKTQLFVPPLPPRDTESVTYPSLKLPSSSSSKSKAPLKALSNPQQALSHLEKHNTHLSALSEEKRKDIEERERWAKAEERASGGKVADDEKVLKKAVKRLEKTKSKSGKEWAERKKTIAQSQETAIKKRNDNIAVRAQARRDKKFGTKDKGKKKKDKGRPGFEGGKKGKKSG